MSILLLRKLTGKSIIGFGNYRDLSVQNVIDMKNHKELIKIYYQLERIDFDDNIKKCLKITGDRVISKPGRDRNKYEVNIYTMLCEISKESGMDWNNYHLKQKDKISHGVFVSKNERHLMNKSFNRNRNQKKNGYIP